MNHSVLKNFAAEARKAFRAAIAARLDHWLEGDSVEHRTHRALIAKLRAELDKSGRAALVDRVAYTWFNRFTALRYLDAADRQPFGARVITGAPGRTRPALLEDTLAGGPPAQLTDADASLAPTVARLRASGQPDTETALYRALLLAACHFYGQKLPFLFEKLDDFAELLLPDDLLSEKSLLAPFRQNLADADCAEVEVLGWLYQYYIAERKDEVMARKTAVPTEDIPAVTQLFTPHWIVRYLVENSLGRLWLLNHPQSKLRQKMPYYVASETPPADFLRIARPEDIKVFDPACGSGHMLTYAFDLLAEIYAEAGHEPKDTARLILENNLFGADLCPRAAALAGFALTMKARALDPRLLRRADAPPVPHILALADVKFDTGEIQNFAKQLKLGSLFDARLMELLGQFEQTTTFGSLIRPVLDAASIAFVRTELDKKSAEFESDLLLRGTVEKVRRVLDQAELLADGRYHAVVANPPYMGRGAMNKELKEFAGEVYPNSKADLFAMFIERGFRLAAPFGANALVTMQSWMFLSSYEELRADLLKTKTLATMAHLGPRGFDMIGGEVVQTTAFVFENSVRPEFKGAYFRLIDGQSEAEKDKAYLAAIANPNCGWFFRASTADFAKIPGSPVAYWLSRQIHAAFVNGVALEELAKPRQGLATGENARFVRCWHEISTNKTALGIPNRKTAERSGCKWFPYNKGGDFNRWYGNQEFVVNWHNDGALIRGFVDEDGRLRSRPQNVDHYFKPSVSWSKISSGMPAFRYFPEGFIFDVAGTSIFADTESRQKSLLGFTNSIVTRKILEAISPTLNFEVGHIASLPIIPSSAPAKQEQVVTALVEISKSDWNNDETSWDFADHPFLRAGLRATTLAQTWGNWDAHCRAAIRRMQELETENNRLWIDAYGLQDELKPEVPEHEITLARADRRKDAAALVSYALGCAFGRYSPDKPGLILANAGDTADRYYELTGKIADTATFPVDADGILPVLDGEWFEDDATARVADFIRRLWGAATHRANLAWLEESLGTDLRSYLAKEFYKDHLKTYKKRPIYWQVSSPKGAFRALFYLHRYDRDTVNRLLNDYLRAFLHKLEERLRSLPSLLESASKTEQTRLKKEAEKIDKQLKEIRDWERATVLPLAQSRLPLDLDDGVKVNYLKFPGLLTPIPGLADKEEE